MGGLPEGWVWAELGEIASSVKNGMYVSRPGAEPNGTPILRIGAVRPMRLSLDDLRYTGLSWQEVQEQAGDVVPGDLLFTRYNGNPEYVGAGARVPDGAPELAYPDKLIRVRVSQQVMDSRFLVYAWASPRVREQVRGEVKTSAGQAGISGASLKRVRVPVPPLPEQHRIVEALEEQLSRLAAAASSVEAAVRRAETLGELLDSRAVAYVDSRSEFARPLSLDEVRSSTKESADRKWKPTDPIYIPGFVATSRWPTVSLGDLAVDRGYGTSVRCSYEGSGAPVLRIPNVQGGVIDLTDMKFAEDPTVDLSDYFVRSGDVLFVRTNGSPSLIGRVGVAEEDTDVAFASYLIRFRLNLEVVDPRWVRLVTQSRIWRRHIERAAASSAGQFNLNSSRLAELPIPLPSLDEQRSIVEQAESQSEEVQRVRGILRRSDRQADHLRASLLRTALEGRLTDQNPTDEPATTLLARIAAERGAVKPARKAKRAARPRKTAATAKATEAAAPAPTPAPLTTVQQELFQ